jgi:hypothetical protein
MKSDYFFVKNEYFLNFHKIFQQKVPTIKKYY